MKIIEKVCFDAIINFVFWYSWKKLKSLSAHFKSWKLENEKRNKILRKNRFLFFLKNPPRSNSWSFIKFLAFCRWLWWRNSWENFLLLFQSFDFDGTTFFKFFKSGLLYFYFGLSYWSNMRWVYCVVSFANCSYDVGWRRRNFSSCFPIFPQLCIKAIYAIVALNF